MNVLVLMAGEGKRFTDQGIVTPKPFVEVNGKTILEWTTRSIPHIWHKGDRANNKIPAELMYFAVRKEHNAELRLTDIYGETINLIEFQKTTRGNLETAYTCATLMDEHEPLLILDSDNKYNDNDLYNTIGQAAAFNNYNNNSMVVCNFEPIDDSHKWAFTITDGKLVKEIVEKDPTALSRGGKPMVGTFWFKTVRMFLDLSEYIITNNFKTGTPGKEEFYLSQVPALHAQNGGLVFAHTVTEMVPLGTPEDVANFAHHTFTIK